MMLLITALTNEKPDDQEYMLNIYEQYKRIMFHTAKKYTADFATAEDLVQDSLVKLIPKISTMRNLDGCTLTAYVVNTVKNTSKNYLRRQAIINRHIVQSQLEDYDTDIDSTEASPEELLLISERMGEFRRVWDNLPEDDREILRGKYQLGLDDQELAVLFNCKPSSIRMKLTRARRRVLKMLKEEDFSYD